MNKIYNSIVKIKKIIYNYGVTLEDFMNKFEKKVYQKYLKQIKKSVTNKYKKMAELEAEKSKIYSDKNNVQRDYIEIKKNIYLSFIPLIENEINTRINDIVSSDKFNQAVLAEKELSRKKLHYKNIKRYQNLPIHISDNFLNILTEEVNKNKNKKQITKDEIRYLTLLIFYAIIDYIKKGFVIKFGTLFRIFCKQRDFVTNLPRANSRIKEDYLFPKIKLCKSFDFELFKKINEDNEAISNYYKAKAERLLILLKIKKTNG